MREAGTEPKALLDAAKNQSGWMAEMLQELVLAAVNEAARRVDDELSKQVKDLAGGFPAMMGMKIPGLF